MKISNTFAKMMLLWLIVTFLLRVWETFSYGYKYSFSADLLQGEMYGIWNDITLLGLVFSLMYFLNFICKKLNINILTKLSTFIFIMLIILHICFLHYFNYQQSLLDVFIFQYPWVEIKHTMATTEANYKSGVWGLGVLLILLFALRYFLKRKSLNASVQKGLQYYLWLAIPLFLLTSYFCDWDVFSRNKSAHFYSKTFNYFFQIGNENKPYTAADAADFQQLFAQHQYISSEYPLLHPFEAKDGLSAFFKPDSTPTNIVVLIMEGLNDDYIHDYRGLSLMPFLSDLSKKSLYWEHCFTLGERSFAAVPCITGSLPYGIKGFNFLKKLPNHLSLTSVLDASGYYTSFFDGQGSWFHNKDRFFQHNNIDLLFDNSKYDPKYKKIIVKDFFWGYNDKDLFQQSLEVMDTLPKQKRLNMYFTGTMHSPFALAEEGFYEKKWLDLCSKTQNETDKKLFQDNAKFYKSILFTDDALADFFTKYKEHSDYKNTIFIITGDHPMTELPRKNSLKRFHVPLIVFSPKLQQAKVFSERVCHLDIYETLLAYLQVQGAINAPKYSTAIGGNLFLGNEKSRPFAFMNDNREVVDYLHGDFYLADNQLFKVDSNFDLTPIKDRNTKQKLEKELAIFNKTNLYVSNKDKLLSDSLAMLSLDFVENKLPNPLNIEGTFEAEYENIIAKKAINNHEKIFEITLEHNFLPNDDCLIVCTTKDKNNKEYYWKGEKIKNKTGFTHAHFKIPAINTSEKDLVFNTFLWNINKQKIVFSDVKIKLYEKVYK